jgi:hypothetical protein
MIKIIFTSIIIIHGLIHLMGFVKAFQLAEINQLTQAIHKPVGLLWLITALLFIIMAAIFLLKKDWWWMMAVPALALSQLLVIMYWQDAKYGTIANVIILVGIIIGYGTWSFNTMTKYELKTFAATATSGEKVVTKEMLGNLPPVVQKWLERSNVVGKQILKEKKQIKEQC